ncbi:hypothetical protein CSW64_20695 [Caulobacter mirabilis]|uniref:TonB C-terminal domain-containing protein n=2 Tax=Caulobacter mirabilis TaxID=69666 RepID=A0A2D2B306_9CAUL|nr:hypothetical protein CSW64_20695 [Caulobacter mirabilis]
MGAGGIARSSVRGRLTGILALLTMCVAPGAAAASEDAAPTWVKRPDFAELRAAWPVEAARQGKGGFVALKCEVNVQGGLETCKVEKEDPPGAGFGLAALSLTPSFQMKPKVVDGRPVRGEVRVPIKFAIRGGMGFAGSTSALVANPLWLRAPTYADVAAVRPARAGDAVSGHASIRCEVTSANTLDDCKVLMESPPAKGFGAAALKLAERFELLPVGDASKDVYVNLAVRFGGAETERAVSHPRWITGLDPKKVAEIFPAAAVERGLVEGVGVAECTVGVGGGLTACKVAREDPVEAGFGEAAVAVAGIMQMSPWTDDGRPVDGAVIRLPIRFKKAPQAAN